MCACVCVCVKEVRLIGSVLAKLLFSHLFSSNRVLFHLKANKQKTRKIRLKRALSLSLPSMLLVGLPSKRVLLLLVRWG